MRATQAEEPNMKLPLLHLRHRASHLTMLFSHRKGKHKGFALVSALLIMSFLLVLTVGMMQFSQVEIKQVGYQTLQEEAESNARLALLMAIGQLQEMTGSDQVVTARAEILSNDKTLVHPNWVGAWKTTYSDNANDIKWPLIGKQTPSGNEIYPVVGSYTDLRQSVPELTKGKWKESLLKGWLVSSTSEIADPTLSFSLTDSSIVELLGKGALGKMSDESSYQAKAVYVEKISITNNAAVAWWTSDNNQKATIIPYEVNSSEHAVASTPGNDLSYIQHDGSYPFKDFYQQSLEHKDKIITMSSAHLSQASKTETKERLKLYTHDLTHHAPGMYTNAVIGGYQRDLTPLLFSDYQERVIHFTPPNSRINASDFFSEYPIINSIYHDVLAPNFSSLRNWGLQKYRTGNAINTELASHASRLRSSAQWPHQQSDGVTYDAAHWAAEMPKIHPVMTDVRWHYYFSIDEGNIRTHIIPRVCLWNPYSKEIQTSEMLVMLPNPFYDASGGFHFYVEEEEVQRLKMLIADVTDSIHSWVKKSASPLEDQYKARLSNDDIFPQQRYLTFVLNETIMGAGECHVFSPSGNSRSSELAAGGVQLARYDQDELSNNTLSSDSAQGGDHFYFDVVSPRFEIQASSSWRALSMEAKSELQLNQIHDYRPESGSITENFPFILKASNGTIPAYDSLLESADHPTLQLINNGTGGVAPSYYFAYSGSSWGSANTISSFGSLQNFQDAPRKDAPATHQVGAKLIWLDESDGEGNRAPLRYGTSSKTRWTSDHMVYHPATIANWNVRAQLTTRSPIAQCAKKWYLFSTGPWILQFIPYSPQDANDSPLLNDSGTAFVKNPFGLSNEHASSPNVALFDLPHPDYGIHSLAALRHAMLSPYSWHPSYIVGHSLRDPHAPAASTAHPEVISSIEVASINHWDHHIGGYKTDLGYGAANGIHASDDLLQIGSDSVSKRVNDSLLTSKNDTLPYDIAYEVNHALWDNYFLSSLPLNESTLHFSSIIPSSQRSEIQPHTDLSEEALSTLLTTDVNSASNGFWLNAYYYRKSSAFNVNSTSIPAWTAFLSGTLQIDRDLADGKVAAEPQVDFSRTKWRAGVAQSHKLDPEQSDAWSGMRTLKEDEILRLATAIVDEVKHRGPFISLADFINRRLTDAADETSHMGALDAAIYKAELNRGFYDVPKYATTTINAGTDPDSLDNNQEIFQDSYRYSAEGKIMTSQAPIKTWGLPSFLMQSDILEPIAPALTVRGDTFTIRAYGESKGKGKLIVTAYIEAIVERTPHYIQHQDIGDSSDHPNKNIATDAALKIDPLTGNISQGNLTDLNEKLGRRYKIISFRWLSKNEI